MECLSLKSSNLQYIWSVKMNKINVFIMMSPLHTPTKKGVKRKDVAGVAPQTEAPLRPPAVTARVSHTAENKCTAVKRRIR